MCDLGLLTSWNFNFQNDKTYSSLVLPETGHCSGHWRYSSELDRGVKLCGAGSEIGLRRILCVFQRTLSRNTEGKDPYCSLRC